MYACTPCTCALRTLAHREEPLLIILQQPRREQRGAVSLPAARRRSGRRLSARSALKRLGEERGRLFPPRLPALLCACARVCVPVYLSVYLSLPPLSLSLSVCVCVCDSGRPMSDFPPQQARGELHRALALLARACGRRVRLPHDPQPLGRAERAHLRRGRAVRLPGGVVARNRVVRAPR